MSKQVMKQALDALESVAGKGKKCDAAIIALRSALDAPEYAPLSDSRIMDAWTKNVDYLDDGDAWVLTFARAIEQEVRGK